METSPTIGKIAGALAKAQGAMKPAAFSKENPAFKNGGKVSRYADLTSVIETSRKALADNSLSMSQSVTSEESRVTVTTILAHAESGEWFKAQTVLKAVKADPQGVGSAMTYGKRYAWCAMLGISADEDDDGNEASSPPAQREVKPTTNGASGKQAFGSAVREWAGVKAEDAVHAARDACKKLGVDPAKVPEGDWPKLCQMIADAKEVFGSFSEWLSSKE